MQKRNFIKSGIAVACLVVASMFGFSAAFGYGGGGGGSSTACTSVSYADWQVLRWAISNIVMLLVKHQNNCVLTASQQAARSKKL